MECKDKLNNLKIIIKNEFCLGKALQWPSYNWMTSKDYSNFIQSKTQSRGLFCLKLPVPGFNYKIYQRVDPIMVVQHMEQIYWWFLVVS